MSHVIIKAVFEVPDTYRAVQPQKIATTTTLLKTSLILGKQIKISC